MAIELGSDIDAVIVVTRTGRTARLIGRHSIKQPMYAFVSADNFVRELSICKGINRAFVLNKVEVDRNKAVESVLDSAKELGIIKAGQNVLFVSKMPYGGESYFPNILEVVKVA
jgi:pyruvate kinase